MMAQLPNPYGGAVDALANYWITRIWFEDKPQPDSQPEWRLEWGGAAAVLDEYLQGAPASQEAAGEPSGLRLVHSEAPAVSVRRRLKP